MAPLATDAPTAPVTSIASEVIETHQVVVIATTVRAAGLPTATNSRAAQAEPAAAPPGMIRSMENAVIEILSADPRRTSPPNPRMQLR